MTPRIALILLLTPVGMACATRGPCAGYQFDRLQRYSLPYAGHWVVARGDTLTLPDAPAMSDRFTIAAVVLDTATVVVRRDCIFRGRLVFARPAAETLAVTWFGQPEQAIVNGWPAELGGGSFAGLALAWAGRDSLRGSLLFSEQLGVQVRSGVTAQFVAGRLSSRP